MNKLKIFKNEMFEVSIQLEDGEVLFDAENVARCLGFTTIAKSGNETIRWSRVNGYLGKLISQEVGKGDFIPEALVYKLAFKASNDTAEKFQDWLAIDVLPQIRRYGMYVKDELLDDPNLLFDVVKRYKEEREEKLLLQKQIDRNKPKVIFADAVSASHTSILVRELATLLQQNGIKMGQNRLFEWLRSNGFLIKRKGTDYNMPTQKSMELGLFEIKETSIARSNGQISISKTSKVTGKGQIYFINKFKDIGLEKVI